MEDQPAADTDQLPRVGPQDNAAFSNHYKRLQSIEQVQPQAHQHRCEAVHYLLTGQQLRLCRV